MSQLSIDAIITLVSAIPALFIASLSAWFAYLALRRHNMSRNDIETSTIEFVLSHANTTPARYALCGVLIQLALGSKHNSLEMHPSSSQTSTTILPPSENFLQLQLPPAALLDFQWDRAPTELVSTTITSEEQAQPVNVSKGTELDCG